MSFHTPPLMIRLVDRNTASYIYVNANSITALIDHTSYVTVHMSTNITYEVNESIEEIHKLISTHIEE